MPAYAVSKASVIIIIGSVESKYLFTRAFIKASLIALKEELASLV